LRGAPDRRVFLVNPRYAEIGGRPCLPSLDAVGEAPDLVLLGVPNAALPDELARAAARGARSAVVFGSAHDTEVRARLRRIAAESGMALCGAGCMGFVNLATGLRAVGYVEREVLPAGPLGVVTHSGSIFSMLLRTRRALGFTLAVSSGQELVTTTADYVDYLLDRTAARVIALVLETVREGPRLVAALRRAADSGVSVVLLPTGGTPAGSALVTAHSGALAGDRGTWEALAEATGALPVADLAELVDTLELLCLAGRPRRTGGIATVHDSGAERALVADLAHDLGVPFAPLADVTRRRLGACIEPGLTVENPLDVWGTGARTRALFRETLSAMTGDPAVAVTALAVDLVPEYDGDRSYPDAVLDVAAETDQPLVVLSGIGAAVDADAATRLRAHGVPVLEGFRSGLVAMRNFLAACLPAPTMPASTVVRARQARWRDRLTHPTPLAADESLALLADYGIPVVRCVGAASEAGAVAAARSVGYPVVLKTDEPEIGHKTEADGVRLAIADDLALRTAYRDLAERLGPRVAVAALAPTGTEVALGIVDDAHLGPLVVFAAGGTLTELVADRSVALPPLDRTRARRMVDATRVARLLAGLRGAAPADVDAVVDAVVAMGILAVELGDRVVALDVNPLIVGPDGAVAVDALIVRRASEEQRCTA
jgi:acyl-CoA synthetase (NDP forming)